MRDIYFLICNHGLFSAQVSVSKRAPKLKQQRKLSGPLNPCSLLVVCSKHKLLAIIISKLSPWSADEHFAFISTLKKQGGRASSLISTPWYFLTVNILSTSTWRRGRRGAIINCLEYSIGWFWKLTLMVCGSCPATRDELAPWSQKGPKINKKGPKVLDEIRT